VIVLRTIAAGDLAEVDVLVWPGFPGQGVELSSDDPGLLGCLGEFVGWLASQVSIGSDTGHHVPVSAALLSAR
jgi:hypothetical protein